jgi:peptidoglycan/LPS O-acetylase OafA/YrhL
VRRLDQVDLLKALAVLGVLLQHGVTPGTRVDIFSSLHADQAVPVFVVLTGLLLSSRIPGARPASWRAADARAYATRRFARLLIPFAATWLAALIVGALIDSIYIGPQTLLGALPIPGPGNYYVPVVLQLVVLVPLVTWAYRRRPLATLAGCLAVNVVFELAWAKLGAIEDVLGRASDFAYDATSLRYLFALALGVWLAEGTSPDRHRSRWLWLGATVAAVYLVLEQTLGARFPLFEPGFERRTNFLVACYPALLVALGLRWLPVSAPRSLRPAVRLGRASYHVFLVQIVWFGAMPEQSLTRFSAGLAASVVVGLLFYRLLPGEWPPAWRRRPQSPARIRTNMSRSRRATAVVDRSGGP